MLVLDASSALHAWDNYPLVQFPSLWNWIERQIAIGELTIPWVALEEVGHKYPECAAWLKASKIGAHAMTQAMLTDALRIKDLLEIAGDAYGKGVDENDLFIIATACALDAELLTDEKRQPSRDKFKKNYKIPAVCDLPEVKVKSLNFVEYFKRSQEVFG